MYIGLLIILGVGAYLIFFKDNAHLQFPKRKRAEDILKERYANGEINDETFIKMKETLNG